jgi:hypothetical protein
LDVEGDFEAFEADALAPDAFGNLVAQSLEPVLGCGGSLCVVERQSCSTHQ